MRLFQINKKKKDTKIYVVPFKHKARAYVHRKKSKRIHYQWGEYKEPAIPVTLIEAPNRYLGTNLWQNPIGIIKP